MEKYILLLNWVYEYIIGKLEVDVSEWGLVIVLG